MRLTALVLALCCGCGKKPATPINMGLWEGTTRREAACSPEVAAYIKNQGLSQYTGRENIHCSGEPIDTTTIVKAHVCYSEASWKQGIQDIATQPAPERCVYTKPFSGDAHGLSATVGCSVYDMTVTIESSGEWPDREHMHWVFKSTAKFRNVAGNSVVKTEINGRFLASDCGSVRPGEHVIVK